MWTPRRIALLVFGFVFYLTGYLLYARSFLGGIDGLPALPEAYVRPEGDQSQPIPPSQPIKMVEVKLKKAFGQECKELGYPIKLELHKQNMVLAAAEFSFEQDGRVCLKPLSVAMFGKEDKGDGRFVEINTIKGKVAYLKFDRPVTNVQEISGRKVVSAELTDNIEVVNNRRTEDRSDDLFVYISKGPLYYLEEKHLIWTHDSIYLKDQQSRPKPMEIRGKGMEMELLAEAPLPKGGGASARKAKQESVTGVKRIMLQSNVDMYLYVDGGSSFMGANADGGGTKKPNPQEAEKSQVNIKTPGRFTYDFGKEHDVATFEVPEADPGQPLRSVQEVMVRRRHPVLDANDMLLCERLVLKLRRRQAAPQKGSSQLKQNQSLEHALEIETAHATGTEVTLTSDAEKLQAHCVDLFYNAKTSTTTLKGKPEMTATKENNDIIAHALQIQEVIIEGDQGKNDKKKYQKIMAQGPGRIDLLDKQTNKKTNHAFWNDTLTTGRDDGHDLLILTGAARFIDDEHEQTLQADTLKVWLDDKDYPPGKANDKSVAKVPAKDTTPQQQTRRPHHVEATGNVLSRSKELYIHDTGRLIVWFKDVPEETLLVAPPQGKQPDARREGQPRPGGGKLSSAGSLPGEAAPPAQAKTLRPGATGNPLVPGSKPNNGEKQEPPSRPIDLTARSVEARVLRSEVKNTLDTIYCEGHVHVQQEPAKPEEKGIDIEGATLQIKCHPEGNFLVVTGDDYKMAQLLMDKIFLVGNEVNIDQAANKAWVNGPGAMSMESATTPGGTKLEKPEPLTVHWNQSMLFNGTFAEFHGGIQADQDKARLACQALQVFFDRFISLKEGNHSDKPAKVKNLVCDRSVRIEETVMDGEKLVKFQQIMGTAVSVDTLEQDDDAPPTPQQKNEGNIVRASGPGSVRIYQPAGPDPLAAPEDAKKPVNKPANKAAQEEEMKLTYVTFVNNMYGNSKTNTATFWGNVRVLNLPTDNPNKDIDFDTMLDNLSREALYLSCEQLTVLSRKVNAKTQQEMVAKNRVVVQSKEFWGRADILTYNEGKDQIIFFGTDTEPARLYRILTKGAAPEEIKGKKIIYVRSTGDFQVDGGNWINGTGR